MASLAPLPHPPSSDLPHISALFLIDFDVKAGYTIVWKRAESGLEIEGLVEYKSLPSGLHTVSDDLVYFVHDGAHAGLSAFVNQPCEDDEARNARMMAVGILVPLSYGRLGRAWRHAEGLKQMATQMVKDRKDTSVLEQYWQAHCANASKDAVRPSASAETPLSSPSVTFSRDTHQQPRKTHGRHRSMSDGAALAPPEQKLSPYHPAWSLTRLLDCFGPLIFPIHRAAILRKRILISCHAPVHQVCDFVYDISILSNIPFSVIDVLPTSSPTQRLQPLFAIGVHDIPFLTEDIPASKRGADSESDGGDDNVAVEDPGSGWIACTTDSILAMKDQLWDVLVTLPPDYAVNASAKVWPTIEGPRNQPIKATQRDLRRYSTLRRGLARIAQGSSSSLRADSRHTSFGPSDTQRSSSSMRSAPNHPQPEAEGEEPMDKLVEPLSWSAFAYNGFMWWATAGEQLRSAEQEETSRDASLLSELEPPSPSNPPGSQRRSSITLSARQSSAANATTTSSQQQLLSSDPLADSLASLTHHRNSSATAMSSSTSQHDETRIELAIIAYFHRLTTQMLTTLADIYERFEDEEQEVEREDIQSFTDRQRPHEPISMPESTPASRIHSRNSSSTGMSNFIDDYHDDDREGSRGDGDSRASHLDESNEDHDDDDDDDDGTEAVLVDNHSIEMMGLDIWSEGDAAFVRGLMRLYFDRRAKIEGKGVEVCGVRVC